MVTLKQSLCRIIEEGYPRVSSVISKISKSYPEMSLILKKKIES